MALFQMMRRSGSRGTTSSSQGRTPMARMRSLLQRPFGRSRLRGSGSSSSKMGWAVGSSLKAPPPDNRYRISRTRSEKDNMRQLSLLWSQRRFIQGKTAPELLYDLNFIDHFMKQGPGKQTGGGRHARTALDLQQRIQRTLFMKRKASPRNRGYINTARALKGLKTLKNKLYPDSVMLQRTGSGRPNMKGYFAKLQAGVNYKRVKRVMKSPIPPTLEQKFRRELARATDPDYRNYLMRQYKNALIADYEAKNRRDRSATPFYRR